MGFLTGGLMAERYDRSYSDQQLIKRIATYFRPQASRIITVALMVVLLAIVSTITPFLIARGVDQLKSTPDSGVLFGLAALITGLGALGWGLNYIRQLFAAQAVGDVVLALREEAFRAMIRRDRSFFDQNASGRIISRVTSDTQDFSTVVTLTIELISQLGLVLVVSIVMLTVNWQMALVTIAVGPVVIGVAFGFRWLARKVMRQSQRAQAEVNAIVQETISGIAVAKNFRQEAMLYNDFQSTNKLAYQIQLQRVAVFGSIYPLLNTLSGLGIAVIIYIGGVFVSEDRVSTGAWYLFVQTLMLFFYPLTSVASFWSQFQQGLAASERVFALIDAEPHVNQLGQQEVGELKGHVALEQVWFSYDQTAVAGQAGASWVLRDFDLTIPAGQTLAIVGHTGAGKSSIVKLLLRFYEFQQGQILVDGRDIRMFDLGAYRRTIGYVPQQPFLFSGSVADNIRYGRPEASDAEVRAAAEQFGDGSWIEDLPNGLDTDVGERGARLSLGQRQLVALARVLLQNPAILLLDEATASIDPLTEAQVQEALATTLKGRTSIVIAHRLSTVRTADRIIVLSSGQIVESGRHEELLAQGGHYAELYTTYFRHQSIDYRPW
ncbi:MAG: ABC transporter ATP-binding protein [Roseiflexaceae bacterium]